jgi:hypothetical protein
MGDCRRWNAEMEEDRDTPVFEEWIRGAMRTYAADAPTEVDVDNLLLCTKPSQKAMRYTKMKAFGNHFRVLDDMTSRMQTYDSSIASVFDVPRIVLSDVLGGKDVVEGCDGRDGRKDVNDGRTDGRTRVVIPGVQRPFGGRTGRAGGRPCPLCLI